MSHLQYKHNINCKALKSQSPLQFSRKNRRHQFCQKIRSQEEPSSETQADTINPNEPVTEELLARLQAAEEKAKLLEKELNKAKLEADIMSEKGAKTDEGPKWRNIRIDGAGLKRETPWGAGKTSNDWLRESDVEFFTGRGPGESLDTVEQMTEEQKAEVNKRILIGGILSAAFVALALIPSDNFQILKPSKPLFFYLVPIIRVQELLKGAETLILDGKFIELQALTERILKEPNNIKQNLYSAIGCLYAGSQKTQAEDIAKDFFERFDQINYQKYYDIRGSPSGEEMKKYQEFSLNALKAASGDLSKFLAIMPQEDVEGAMQSVFPNL
eukprot:TRINITY_DN5128_c0_g1_i3.p2 TRINITY_DN5128_c0_g1~~TRINITY_DN5128_c0_g1_i3.p2  ORF type:complete len:357 (-),score=39.57 TRINITY_DN5128_c0_g1_i3:230-1216(-)